MSTETTVQDSPTQQIEKLRDILKPAPVNLSHEPLWLQNRIRAAFGESMPVSVAVREMNNRVTWLDHWGSIEDGNVFVSEPYLTVDMVIAAKQFADRLGLNIRISANSEWYPGFTSRLELWESE